MSEVWIRKTERKRGRNMGAGKWREEGTKSAGKKKRKKRREEEIKRKKCV